MCRKARLQHAQQEADVFAVRKIASCSTSFGIAFHGIGMHNARMHIGVVFLIFAKPSAQRIGVMGNAVHLTLLKVRDAFTGQAISQHVFKAWFARALVDQLSQIVCTSYVSRLQDVYDLLTCTFL